MSLISYKQRIFGRCQEEKEELRMRMEGNTLLSHAQVVFFANVLFTLYVTLRCSKCIQSIHSHSLANRENFDDYFKIIYLCILMERKKGLVTITLFEVNIGVNHDIKFVHKQTQYLLTNIRLIKYGIL